MGADSVTLATMREPTDVPDVPSASPAVLSAAADAGIDFEPGDIDRLHGYLRALYEANAVMNLTAVRDPADAWSRHVLDSLTLLPWIAGLRGRDHGFGDLRFGCDARGSRRLVRNLLRRYEPLICQIS